MTLGAHTHTGLFTCSTFPSCRSGRARKTREESHAAGPHTAEATIPPGGLVSISKLGIEISPSATLSIPFLRHLQLLLRPPLPLVHLVTCTSCTTYSVCIDSDRFNGSKRCWPIGVRKAVVHALIGCYQPRA